MVSKSIELTPQKRRLFAAVVAMMLLSAAAGFGGGYYGGKQSSSSSSLEAKQQIISSESELVSSIAKSVGQSVVSVNVSTQQSTPSFFDYFDIPAETQSAGTGVIINDKGVVITNRHVVPAGTTSVSVTLSDGTELTDVEIIGRTSPGDPIDVAFLKIKDAKGKTLVPATLGDSSKVEVGEKVIAIGNALGQFQNTVTAGIISGYGRNIEASGSNSSVETLQNLFQTDTAINPGNSGGPLVNINGEVIGINVAEANAENIGFAIPINDIKGLIASVEKTGKLLRPYLGVRYISLTDDYAYTYNLDTSRGAYIAPGSAGRPSILPNSPAEKAGLKEKDIITAVGGQKIDENNSLVSVLGRYEVGQTVELSVVRDNQQVTLRATLEAASED